jgi:hypothetical protein
LHASKTFTIWIRVQAIDTRATAMAASSAT